jgi:hypothetical protein
MGTFATFYWSLDLLLPGAHHQVSRRFLSSNKSRQLLALVDIHLNGPMDGIELAQLLRNDSAYSRFSFPVSATTRPLSERERHAPWASFRRLFGRARYSVLLIERLTIGWIDVPGTPSGINSSFLPCR